MRYVVGPYGVDDGGGLLLLFRSPTDRGRPQFDDPGKVNYSTVSTTGGAMVTAGTQAKLYVRPWTWGVRVDVSAGPLAPGDVVEVVLGDTRGGGPGLLAKSYTDPGDQMRVMVDPFATGRYYDVGYCATPVIADRAESLIAVVDSEATHDDPVRLTVRAVDRFGNVATTYRGSVRVVCADDVVLVHTFTEYDNGVVDATLSAPPEGTYRLVVTDDASGFKAVSNPLVVGWRAPRRRLLWGDTQAQSGETVGSGSLDAFFSYARDVARIDFIAHSANDFQLDNGLYADVLAAVDHYSKDDRFIAFGGFEWSGNTPTGGDHNVLFADTSRAPLMRSSHALVEDLTDLDTDARTVGELSRRLREDRIDALCVAHVGGRVCDLGQIEPDTTPAVEIVSVHGWFEWLALEALQLGLTVGFLGASDDHSGRPGASFPSARALGARSGLAAVRAEAFTRAGILQAIRERHGYATTGERIQLEVTCDGHVMGDRWLATEVGAIRAQVMGTAGIERIDLMGADGVQATWRPDVPEGRRRLRVGWRGAKHRFRGRTIVWDGYLTIAGASILGAEAWAMEHPEDGITHCADSTVGWKSSTNGDPDGVILTLDVGEAAATLHFATGPYTADIDLAGIADGGTELPVPNGLDCAVTVQWLPDTPLPMDATTQFTPQLRPGLNAFLVRIAQDDGHKAWSSPLFIDQPDTTSAGRSA